MENKLTRQAICQEALTWVGTPYYHRACVKKVGVDCAMLLVGIGKALGVIAPDWEAPAYAPQWHVHQQDEWYRDALVEQGFRQSVYQLPLPGDILLFRWEVWQPLSHAAILMPGWKMVHARYHRSPGKGQVRHEPINSHYQSHLAATYRWPGVTA